VAAIRRTGVCNANCIFFSISLSFPSLNPCSASILSLFLFAASLCLSKVSLTARLSLTVDNEKLRVLKFNDIFSNCCDTVVNVSEFCVSKLVVCGSGCCGRTLRPVKTLEDTLLLIPLILPASGDAKPCSSSILFLLCF